MKKNYNRRRFVKTSTTGSFGLFLAGRLSGNHINTGLVHQPGKPYDWIKNARIFIVDGFTYPLTPRLEFDAEKLAGTMKDMHANVLRIATSGFCDWLIPGTDFKPADDLAGRDILAECIIACRPRGIKVVPYIRTGGSIKTSSMNPDWAYRSDPSGTIRSTWDLGEKTSALCWNSKYSEAFLENIEILVSKYDIDGIYFDSWFPFYGFASQVCYCEGCRNGYRDFSGKNIPYDENDDYSPDQKATLAHYREWYNEEVIKVFNKTKGIIKSYKDIPLIYNINNPDRIARLDMRYMDGCDAFLYERGKSMIERAEGVSLASAHGITVWPYVGTYDPFPRIPHFSYELGQEIFTSVAFGGSPILYHTYFFTDHPECREPVKEAFGIIEKNFEYFKGFRSEEFCAVIYNDTDPPGHAIRGYLWDTNARLSSLGSFSACIKSHIQTTSLLKADLARPEILNKYKVLYLPDICFLTEPQISNIKEFVRNGGGLVITYSTSLYDAGGNKRSDFALADPAQIRFQKPDEKMTEKMMQHSTFGSVWDLYLKTRPGQKVIKSLPAGRLIPMHVYETVTALPGGTVIADIVSGRDNQSLAPGIVVSEYGKGRVAYISSAIGAMYLQTGIKEFADLIRDVIKYVSPGGIAYDIDAPHSTLITNSTVNGNKRVFHLITWNGSQSERMWQNVYHIPPIENVTIKFKVQPGMKIKKISPFIPADIAQKREDDVLSIYLSRIEKYQGIIIEME